MAAVQQESLAMSHRNTGTKIVETIKDGELMQKTRIGPAAEALRRINLSQLKDHMEAFYDHGTLADMLLLCAAFERIERERLDWSPERAWLVDALLMLCEY